MSVVLNKAEREILIYDEIGFGDSSAKAFVEALNGMDGEPVTVRINSPGGSVFDGLAIQTALNDYEGTVTIEIDGVALSMASGIAMVGDLVRMASNGLMMIHDPQGMAGGGIEDMKRATAMLEAAKKSLVTAYVTKSGLPEETVVDMMTNETWLTATEAKDLNLIDEIGSEAAIAASINLPDSISVPASLAEQLMNVTRKPEVKREPEMSDTKTPEAKKTPEPATLEQLSGLNGATNDFVIDQLKAKATLEQAQNSLNRILVEQLEAKEAEMADAVENAKREAEEAKQAANIGQDPVGDAKPANSDPWPDPLQTFNKLFDEAVQRHGSRIDAYRAVNKANPGLVNAVRDQYAK